MNHLVYVQVFSCLLMNIILIHPLQVLNILISYNYMLIRMLKALPLTKQDTLLANREDGPEICFFNELEQNLVLKLTTRYRKLNVK